MKAQHGAQFTLVICMSPVEYLADKHGHLVIWPDEHGLQTPDSEPPGSIRFLTERTAPHKRPYLRNPSLHFIITARIRSMTGRYCFHRCLSVNISGGGTPSRSGWWGTPSQVWLRGVSHPRSGWGYPIPGLAKGGTPSQVWLGRGYPISVWGTPATPSPTQHGMGYPPRHGTGYLPDMGWGNPPRQISIASTCYMSGSMLLAFTQEDFLVLSLLSLGQQR